MPAGAELVRAPLAAASAMRCARPTGAGRRRARRSTRSTRAGTRRRCRRRAPRWTWPSASARASCCRATSTTSAKRCRADRRDDAAAADDRQGADPRRDGSRARAPRRRRSAALDRDHRRRLLRRRQRQLVRRRRRQARSRRARSAIPAIRRSSMPGPTCPTWHALSSPSPRSTTLAPFERFAFAGHSVTGTEFLAAVERAAASLGLAPARGWRRSGMPWPLIRIAGLVVPLWRELARMSYLWRVPHALDGRRLATRCPGLDGDAAGDRAAPTAWSRSAWPPARRARRRTPRAEPRAPVGFAGHVVCSRRARPLGALSAAPKAPGVRPCAEAEEQRR